ncbi:hypothetical protein EDB87DRAFT_1680452 [Lactarius vividus]|nr:hypothetical protein EDB87DRAFT_1680452 [Lactarius vividus]
MTLSSVPVLLNEFPAPPSYIPQNISTPSSSLHNPPPSLPPSLPLPPIPGPSPLSEQDLFHITAATRASRLSTSSRSSSVRESVVSVASGSSGPSPISAPTVVTTQPSGRQRTGSVTSTSTNSVRSYSSSNGSLSVPLPSFVTTRAANPDHSKFPPVSVAVNPAILEDDEFFTVDPVEHVLTHTSLADIPRATPSPLPYPGHGPLHNDPISSIDMRDLPALLDDDTTDLDSQAHVLHVQMRAARSKSSTHKLRVRQAVSQARRNCSPTGGDDQEHTPLLIRRNRTRHSSGGPDHESPAFPENSRPDRTDRASSPDIATFIAATPRPRRRSETSSRSRSRSQPRPRAPKSLPGSRRTSAVGRLSLFSLPDESVRRQSEGSATLASRSLLAYANRPGDDDGLWNDDSFVEEDYGVVIGSGDDGFPSVADEEDAAGESDSSIDLHTPLPHLMLRDGMLSPHSKLLPQNTRADSLLASTDGNRPGSTVSAVTPKSGIFKDERDTIRRRVRHRDGRLLRGGIGLTTGLGWSDSEDEDAPSPLTKRLSNLSLSRQSSATSVKTGPRTSRSHPHPLSRSFSGGAKVYPSNSTQNLRRTVLPPTSWQKRNRATASTLSVSIPEHDSPELSSQARFSEPSYRADSNSDSQSNDQVRTPSSSSTQSLPGPITPDVSDLMSPHSAPVRLWDRDKSLPPLPLSRGPSSASLRPPESFSDAKNLTSKLGVALSGRSISPGSELSDPVVVSSRTPRVQHFYTAQTPRTSRSTPRPLQLSASLGAVIEPGEPASKQGRLLNYNRQIHDQQRARALSGPSPSVSTSQRYSVRPFGSMKLSGSSRSESMDLSFLEPGEPRLRPRTGTGMVYKKSSTSLTRAAADVQAQSRLRMPSERTSSVAS